MELFLFGCGNRANVLAVAAADALISIDNVDIALGNALNGALRSASAACDACIGNLVCHGIYLQIINDNYILTYYSEKSSGF